MQWNKENLVYLAESAVITRLLIGAVRVYQNKVNKIQDPELSKQDKKKSFWERIFVELVGTVGYLLVLHGGQDVTAKLLERMKWHDVKAQLQKQDTWLKGTLNEAEKKRALQAVDEVFGEAPWGRIEQILYGDGRKHGNMLNAFKAHLSNEPELYDKVEKALEPVVKRLNKAACASIVGGVAASALFGGFVIQWVNDRLVSPIISVLLDEFAKPSGVEMQAINGQPQASLQHIAPPASNSPQQPPTNPAGQQQPASAQAPAFSAIQRRPF